MPNQPRQDWSALLDGDVEAADALWSLTEGYQAPEATDIDVDRAWGALECRLAAARGSSPADREHRVSRRRFGRLRLRRALPAAAAAAVILLLVVNYFAGSQSPVASYANLGEAPRAVQLPDESTVTLAPGTTVDFAATDAAREAVLQGEARFDVTSEPARPFAVVGHGFRLVVVGTAFTVATGEPSSVVVHEGHVRLRGALEADWIDLYAGDSALVVGHLVEQPDSGGPGRPLAFSSTPLREVVAALSAEGVVDIQVPDGLAGCPVAADFTDLSAADVAEALAVTFGAELRRRGDRFVLRGGSCD